MWALRTTAFRAVISTSFADIFRGNALKNGLVPVEVPEDVHERLLAAPTGEVVIDVGRATLTLPDGTDAPFPLEPFARYCLLEGVDELEFLLSRDAEIAEYEKQSGPNPGGCPHEANGRGPSGRRHRPRGHVGGHVRAAGLRARGPEGRADRRRGHRRDRRSVPAETLALCSESTAVFLGAVGGPKWDGATARPEAGLLGLRRGLGLHANLRPARYMGLPTPLREGLVRHADLLVVRDLAGGVYFGEPRGTATASPSTPGRRPRSRPGWWPTSRSARPDAAGSA